MDGTTVSPIKVDRPSRILMTAGRDRERRFRPRDEDRRRCVQAAVAWSNSTGKQLVA
jgi:hypothetical protein